MSADVLQFGGNQFKIAEENDTDQEDQLLQQELQKLIVEHLEDFDLGEESENYSIPDDNTKSNNALEEDLSSILVAGRLSILEGAIQKFGDEISTRSDNTMSQQPASIDCQDIHENYNLSSKQRHSKEIHHSTSSVSPFNQSLSPEGVQGIPRNLPSLCVQSQQSAFPSSPLKQTVNSTTALIDGTINWDLSLPGEVGTALYVALQNEVTTKGTLAQDSTQTTNAALRNVLSLGLNSQLDTTLTSPSEHHGVAINICTTQRAILQPSESQWNGSDWFPTAETVGFQQGQRESFGLNEGEVAATHGIQDGGVVRINGAAVASYHQEAEEAVQYHPEQTDAVYAANYPVVISNLAIDHREALYAARGQQIQELSAEISRLKEEISRERRIAGHRATLAEGERQALSSEVEARDILVVELRVQLEETLTHLTEKSKQLKEEEKIKSSLTDQLTSLQEMNASLSSQLVELTTGDSIRRAEERENKLAEAIQRRCSTTIEEMKGQLEDVKRKLADKENEVTDLQRQIQVKVNEAQKSRNDHHEALQLANRQLEEAQQQCQKLASSALCAEVTSLRQRVSDFEVSKRINEDVNKILQDELHDLREQLTVYEGVLRLESVALPPSADLHQDQLLDSNLRQPLAPPKRTLTPVSDRPPSGGAKSVNFADQLIVLPADEPRPSSALPNLFRHQGDTCEVTVCRRGSATPETEDNEGDAGAGEGTNTTRLEFRAWAQRPGVATSTPAMTGGRRSPQAGAAAQLARLRGELENCLAEYRRKRQQVTRLHETVFVTRCQLHQTTQALRQTEANSAKLQDQVVTLERTVSTLREMGDNPGPREAALNGQVERLKQDYAKLENDLQDTRARLQTALAAEARALEKQRATEERLEAVTSEREAAVERARGACEDHHAALRRHLEAEWNGQREATVRSYEDQLARVSKTCTDLQEEVVRLTRLQEQAQLEAQQSVEMALTEAMQAREQDRMVFWREELPNQLQAARSAWEQEFQAERHLAVRNAIQEARRKWLKEEKDKKASPRKRSPMTASVPTDTRDLIVHRDAPCWTGGDLPLSVTSTQTDLGSLPTRSPAPAGEQDFWPCSGTVTDGWPELVRCLSAHLIETASFDLIEVVQQLRTCLLAHVRVQLEAVWSSLSRKIAVGNPPMNGEAAEEAAAEQLLSCLPNAEQLISLRGHVLSQLSQLVHRRPARQVATVEVGVATTLVEASSNWQSADQMEAMYRIRDEVMSYVTSCQNRAAQLLHSQLSCVHRRACRQFTAQLRRALCDAGLSAEGQLWSRGLSAQSSRQPDGSSGPPHSLSCLTSESGLESLLHIIDAVCSATETRFHCDLTTGLPVFNVTNSSCCPEVDKVNNDNISGGREGKSSRRPVVSPPVAPRSPTAATLRSPPPNPHDNRGAPPERTSTTISSKMVGLISERPVPTRRSKDRLTPRSNDVPSVAPDCCHQQPGQDSSHHHPDLVDLFRHFSPA